MQLLRLFDGKSARIGVSVSDQIIDLAPLADNYGSMLVIIPGRVGGT
jgi:hypothetical protein